MMPKITGYQVLSKIGEGAMSEVFMAKTGQNTVVAIKVLRHFFKDRESYVERLKKEAKTMSMLRDERIVKCLEIIKTDEGIPALVCEFVDGKNLEQVANNKSNGIIAACIISEILLGLEEAHRQGIVHRDLKPENILLTKLARIKITDFGVAKNLESQEMTVTGLVMGSPAYMAPEQILGESVDEKTDLYALGVMLYYFSTGELPFNGETYGELSQKVLKGIYQSAEKINPNIHPELIRIMNKALHRNRDERYQKAYEFRYDLMRWMDELCLPSIQDILFSHYAGEDLNFIQKGKLVETLIHRARQAKDDKNNVQMNQYLQQVLTLDPNSNEARELLNNHQQSKIIAATFFLFLALTGFYLYQFSSKPMTVKETKMPTKIEKQQPISTRGFEFFDGFKKKLRIDRIKIKQAAIIRKRPRTGVQFFVGKGVEVYLDGEKIQDINEPFITTAGSHDVMLVKPGFNPITSKIYVVKNQITKINAR